MLAQYLPSVSGFSNIFFFEMPPRSILDFRMAASKLGLFFSHRHQAAQVSGCSKRLHTYSHHKCFFASVSGAKWGTSTVRVFAADM